MLESCHRLSYFFNTYPNPAQNYLNILLSVKNEDAEELSIEISDISGRVVLTEEMVENVKQKRIDLSSIKPGTYICSLKCKQGYLKSNTFIIE